MDFDTKFTIYVNYSMFLIEIGVRRIYILLKWFKKNLDALQSYATNYFMCIQNILNYFKQNETCVLSLIITACSPLKMISYLWFYCNVFNFVQYFLYLKMYLGKGFVIFTIQPKGVYITTQKHKIYMWLSSWKRKSCSWNCLILL